MSSESVVHLSSTGKIIDKTSRPDRGGFLCSLCNYTVRGHLWKMTKIAFHRQSADFATADDRGQIYFFSTSANVYYTLRMASVTISSLEFVHCKPSHLIVAYMNGIVLIVDTTSKDVVANVRFRGSDPIYLIRSHPTRAISILVSHTGVIHLHDMRSLKCNQTIHSQEPIVDVQFINGGSLVSVTFCYTGTIIYDMSTFQPIMRCTTPEEERRPPSWVSVCHHESTDNTSSLILLGSSNGAVYCFDMKFNAINDDRSSQSMTESIEGAAVRLCPLLCVIELPPEAGLVVSMSIMNSRASNVFEPNNVSVLMLLDTGVIYVVNSIDKGKGIWEWIVRDTLPITISQGVPDNSNVNNASSTRLAPVIYGNVDNSDHGTPTAGLSHTKSRSANKVLCVPSIYTMGTCCIEGDSSFYATVALDGSIRLFDWNAYIDRLTVRSEGKPKDKVMLRSRLSYNHNEGQHVHTLGQHTNTSFTSHTSSPKKKEKPFVQSKVKAMIEGRSSEHSLEPPQNSSLFILASTKTNQKHLSQSTLSTFLEKNKRFPETYRPLIWRYLLQLPENEGMFSELLGKGTHEKFIYLHKSYPITDRRVFQRLQSTCSCIANWSPVFGEISYIPQLVFPFVVLFGSDELAALESAITILMWWGRSWQATFPHPPVHITDILDALLQHHDEQLRTYFYKLDVAPGLIAWKMLSTLFSEILPKDSWLCVMDYLLVNIQDYSLFYIVPIAIFKMLRSSILTSQTQRNLINFLRFPQALDPIALIQILKVLRQRTPAHLLLGNTLNTSKTSLKGTTQKPYDDKDLELKDIRESIADSEGAPIFPLPRGRYPAFDGYPPHLVDWQVKERSIALSMQQEISSRESALEELEARIAQIDIDHREWLRVNQHATQTEVDFKISFMEKEKKHIQELSAIEERISRQRIENLRKIEAVAKEEMDIMNDIKLKSTELLQNTQFHMQDKIESALNIQRHREVGDAADIVMQNGLSSLYLNRMRGEQINKVTKGFETISEDIQTKNRMIIEKWRQEDEMAKAQSTETTQRLKKKMEEKYAKDIEAAIAEGEVELLQQRQNMLRIVERERAMRLLSMQELEMRDFNDNVEFNSTADKRFNHTVNNEESNYEETFDSAQLLQSADRLLNQDSKKSTKAKAKSPQSEDSLSSEHDVPDMPKEKYDSRRKTASGGESSGASYPTWSAHSTQHHNANQNKSVDGNAAAVDSSMDEILSTMSSDSQIIYDAYRLVKGAGKENVNIKNKILSAHKKYPNDSDVVSGNSSDSNFNLNLAVNNIKQQYLAGESALWENEDII